MKKGQNWSDVVLSKSKNSREKRRGSYISNLKTQNEKLKMEVKLFTNKNGRLERIINKSASAMVRSSLPEVFCKKGVLWNCVKFTESLF